MPTPARVIATPVEQEPEVSFERTTVVLDRNEPCEVRKFKCDNCGYTAFRYYCNIKTTTPGRPGFAGPIIEVQCHSRMKVARPGGVTFNTFCKKRYYLTF